MRQIVIGSRYGQRSCGLEAGFDFGKLQPLIFVA